MARKKSRSSGAKKIGVRKAGAKKKIFTRGKEDTCSTNSCGFGGYGLGVIGAAVYYISTATSFWVGVLGLLKSLVWPAFVVYEILKYVAA